MNKKMLLVALMPFAMHAHVAELLADVKENLGFFSALANKPFGDNHEVLNTVAAAVNHDLAQSAVKKYVSAFDAKVLGKTLVDAKGVKLATGDILCFAAAVGLSCVNDRLNDNKNSHAQNAVAHTATRLVVVALDKAYDAVAPTVASLIGVETLGLDATINEAFPEVVASAINSVRTTLERAAVYGVTRNAVERVAVGFFAQPTP